MSALVLAHPASEWATAATRARSLVPDTWLYFIQAGSTGPIKIGVAKHPLERMKTLQTASPVELFFRALEWSSAGVERDLHRIFAAHRVRGEWFAPHPDLFSFVAEVAWLNKYEMLELGIA